MKKILVTGYTHPDLDGTACAFAYSKFLQKKGKNAIGAIFGQPHREAQFVFDKFKISPLPNADKIIDSIEDIIIVDSSDLLGLSNKIDPDKVIEVIDHRKINDSHMFPNAKVQIELVGSAATLIAEKYYADDVEIDNDSAVLLYSAIVSNTINFQANVTTDRDHHMAKWLKTKLEVPDTYVHDMFTFKSIFTKPLRGTFVDDYVSGFTFGGKKLAIIQLEIINVDGFVNGNLKGIKSILNDLKNDHSLDLIFLTCIDLENAFNKFIVVDTATQTLLENILDVQFSEGIAYRQGILMRKEIVPLIKSFME